MVDQFSEKQKAFIASQGVLRFNSLTPDGSAGAKRWRNLRKNNVASIELDAYMDDWSGNRGLLVYGKATFLQPGQEEQRRAMSLLKEKYVQYRERFKLNDSMLMGESVTTT